MFATLVDLSDRDFLPSLQIALNIGGGLCNEHAIHRGSEGTFFCLLFADNYRHSKDGRICIYLWILFTSVTCLQVLDQIIEDRKRRAQLEVLLLVLLQLLCSILLLQSNFFLRVVFVLLEDYFLSYSGWAFLGSASEYWWGCCTHKNLFPEELM